MKLKVLCLTAGLLSSPAAACLAQDGSAAGTPERFQSASTGLAMNLPGYRFEPARLQPLFLASNQPETPLATGTAFHLTTAAESASSGAAAASGSRSTSWSPLGFFSDRNAGKSTDENGSSYIPMDSWIYPEMSRLYSMGYASTMFLGMRPFTRRSLLHILQVSQDQILADSNEEATGILAALLRELSGEVPANDRPRGTLYGVESGYTRMMGIGGPVLRDSYHLGQTIANDYGRPYQPGFNNLTGFSALAERGRFSLYVRGEYQHSPQGPGYPTALINTLTSDDNFELTPPLYPNSTVPQAIVPGQNPFRLVEANLSVHLLGNEISGGKSDAWLGPGLGSAMAWSNNAEDIYSVRVNRIEPLWIPGLSRVVGPIRYDFFYGSLKGHSVPNDDWTHSTMISFRPTKNFEFGFQRTVVFGGHGHEPVTLHTFLRSFFSIADVNGDEKLGRSDPGARFSDFNFSWRLPFLRKYTTLYVDSITHDDVSPITAPRRASYRTGVELSQIPGMRKLEFRVEGVNSNPPVTRSTLGDFMYFEGVQQQAYTNKGFIMGDWIGRQATGGQAFVTYHLSGSEYVQVEYLNKKTPVDFIPGGTTQNQFKATLIKRFHHDLEVNAWVQYERWKAPIYKNGLNSDTTATVQLTYYPKLHSLAPGK